MTASRAEPHVAAVHHPDRPRAPAAPTTPGRAAPARFATELVGFEQDDEGVSGSPPPRHGPERTIRADYLVAADGAHSPVRSARHPMDGRGASPTASPSTSGRHARADRTATSASSTSTSPSCSLSSGSRSPAIRLPRVFATIDRRRAGTRTSARPWIRLAASELVRKALGGADFAGRDRERAALVGRGGARVALPGGTGLPRRRRRARHAADRRFGGNTGIARRPQPRLEAGLVVAGTAGPACSTPTTPSAGRSAG